MDITVSINIEAPAEDVWQSIVDIDNCMEMISTIIAIEVLDRPKEGLVGLKWKETRLMFGKEADETMWVVDAVENEYYRTRAESHGSIYLTRLSLSEKQESNCILTMCFEGLAQSYLMKMLSVIIIPLMKNSMKKMLLNDLRDIKSFVEKNN